VKWNGSAYSSLGSGFGGSGCLDVAVIGIYVYVSLASSVTSYFSYRWNGSTWDTIGSGIGSGAWRFVGDDASNVYCGGGFYKDGIGENLLRVFARYGNASLKEILDYLFNRANAVSSILGGNPIATLVGAVARYVSPGMEAFNATEANASFCAPRTGYLRNLYVRTSTAQPAGGAMDVDVRIGGVNSGLYVQIPAGGAAGSYTDLANIVYVVAGSLITVRFNNLPLAVSANVTSWGMEFV
jgi:hypothetical protein